MITGTLTVRENILFSAALRLSCSHEQRQEIVDSVIEELGLTSVANEKVYSYIIKIFLIFTYVAVSFIVGWRAVHVCEGYF